MPAIRVNDVRRARSLDMDPRLMIERFRNVARNGKRARTSEPLRASMWTVPTADGAQQYAYTFPFTPQQIQYSNLSPELSEINRPGRTPIVAFSRFRARQIALRFLIAVPQDGLFRSVDESIYGLQQLVNSRRPVYFTNLDKQITNTLSSDGETQVFWSITEFNISSVRRNAENKIVSAEADITLVENINPKIKVADLPKISYTQNAPKQSKAGTGSKSGDFLAPTWTETYNRTLTIGGP